MEKSISGPLHGGLPDEEQSLWGRAMSTHLSTTGPASLLNLQDTCSWSIKKVLLVPWLKEGGKVTEPQFTKIRAAFWAISAAPLTSFFNARLTASDPVYLKPCRLPWSCLVVKGHAGAVYRTSDTQRGFSAGASSPRIPLIDVLMFFPMTHLCPVMSEGWGWNGLSSGRYQLGKTEQSKDSILYLIVYVCGHVWQNWMLSSFFNIFYLFI